MPILNQYNRQTGNYFNIFDYDHANNLARPITVSGGPIAFQATSASGSASINFDTEIVLQTDLLLGYSASGNIDINSNAGLSNFTNNIPTGLTTSFSSPGFNLYVANICLFLSIFSKIS